MFWKKKKKFNLYQDEVEYVSSDENPEETRDESPAEEVPADTDFIIEEEPAAEYAETPTATEQEETESSQDDSNHEEIPAEDASYEKKLFNYGYQGYENASSEAEESDADIPEPEAEPAGAEEIDADRFEPEAEPVGAEEIYADGPEPEAEPAGAEEINADGPEPEAESAGASEIDAGGSEPEAEIEKKRFSLGIGKMFKSFRFGKKKAEVQPEEIPPGAGLAGLEDQEADSAAQADTAEYADPETGSYAASDTEEFAGAETDSYSEPESAGYAAAETGEFAGSEPTSEDHTKQAGYPESETDTPAEAEGGDYDVTDANRFEEAETDGPVWSDIDNIEETDQEPFSVYGEDDTIEEMNPAFYETEENPEEPARKKRFSPGIRNKLKSFSFKKKKEESQSDEEIKPGFGLENPKKKLSGKKLAAIVATVVIVVGVAIFFVVRNLGGAGEGKVYVESVGEITGLGTANGMSNRYTGEVEPQDSWKITLQSDLSVSECYVQVGDEVKEGDKLFSYNTEEIKLNKEKKELEVETLTNEMNQLNKDIAGYQNDLRTASASEKIELQTQILTAQTTIKKDEFTIKSSKDEIENLEKRIKDATVTSKMSGVVKSINRALGSSSEAADEDTAIDESGDNAYMTILALGDYRVKGKVSETNISMLNEGDPVIIRSRVDEKAIWTGTISQIKTDTNVNASSDSGDTEMDMSDVSAESASYYNFFVKLNDDTNLMMGQHVLIEVDYGQGEEREGIWLNSAYLHEDGDKYYVWASNNRDRLTLREVKVGEYNEDLDEYQILSGLQITDYIAADAGNLHEGMRTTKVAPESESTEFYDEEENDDDEFTDSEEDESSDDEISDDELFEDETGGAVTGGTGGENGFGADVVDDSQGF